MPTDPLWLAEVFKESPYMFIKEWSAEDWVALLVAVLVVAWARSRLAPDLAVAGLLTAVLAVAVLAVAGSVAVYYTPFALILQGQPFRALWLLQAMAVLLAMAMARDLWSRGDGPWRGAAVLLIWYMGDGTSSRTALGLTLLFPLAAAWLRGTARAPRDPGWLWRSLAVSLLAAEVLDLGSEFTSFGPTRPLYAGLLDRSTLTYLALATIPPACAHAPGPRRPRDRRAVGGYRAGVSSRRLDGLHRCPGLLVPVPGSGPSRDRGAGRRRGGPVPAGVSGRVRRESVAVRRRSTGRPATSISSGTTWG